MFGLFGTFGVLNWPSSQYNDRVKDAQTKLKELGFEPGTIDGRMGTNTKGAVTKFEKEWGISSDESWADFLNSLGVAYAGRPTRAAAPAATASAAAAPASQSQVMSTAAGVKPPGVLSKLSFKDPKVIAGAGIVGLGIVLLLVPKSGGSSNRKGSPRRKGRR